MKRRVTYKENAVGKEEIARYTCPADMKKARLFWKGLNDPSKQQFLLSPQYLPFFLREISVFESYLFCGVQVVSIGTSLKF